MGGTVPVRIAVAVGLVLAAGVLTGCGSAASDRDGSSPEPSGPARPLPTSTPTTTPTTTPAPPTTVDQTVGGWDIRYREDGHLKVLKVEDFPR